ncbi:RNA-guided endonuclease InsQ/TnpB family protein [Methanocella conradii]|uniref:RNA-guided endonuclease InsQ/TnpB family protein n=1 Tax=Methanocella conradii TaxID=1175444 RepID=UPI0024B36649|nr:transposase [Methanocella conradii]MDI6896181.1 transposase [Methanocella conradii]
MQLSYKYRACPDREVEKKLFHCLDLCCWLYNTLLGILDTHRGEFGKQDTQNAVAQIKQVYPELDDVHSKVLQMVNHRLWAAIKGLSKLRKKGHRIGRLKYKKRDRYNTLEYNQSGFSIDTVERTAWFSKIGTIRFDMHRPLPEDGTVKGIIITRQNGAWYLVMQVEVPDVENKLADLVELGEPVPEEMLLGKKVVGIDVNIGSFTDYDGAAFHNVENPKLLDRKLDELRYRQRSLGRKKKGSNNRRKAQKLVGRVYERVKNIRTNRNHQLSRKYVDAYDIIVVEDNDILGMVSRQHGVKKLTPKARRTLRRNILDAGWGDFVQKLGYKATQAGKLLLKICPRNTTQRCSHCGSLVYKDITKRTHKCPYCGLVIDRDENSAENIRSDGITILRAGNRPEPEERLASTRKYRASRPR